MKELSIFIDESGDLGKYEVHSPFYLISMVFHDQKNSISSPINKLSTSLTNMGLPKNFYIHVGPAIRKEGIYKSLSPEQRRRLISNLAAFFRATKTTYCTFEVKKRIQSTVSAIHKELVRQISSFIQENLLQVYKYDIVKIYYDNGQAEVSKIISEAFDKYLNNVAFRKVSPYDYKLFQVADLVCTFHLIALKIQRKTLSKTERGFFRSEKYLQKNYLKQIKKQHFAGTFC